jgi:hypothetical protein
MSPRFSITPPAQAATQEEITAADEVLAHSFTFHSEKHQLPQQIDWTNNPGTAHWGHDLNRFPYLEPLAKAYRTTGERRYADKARDLILSWIERSKTVNFEEPSEAPYILTSYLNVAIHLGNWMRCLTAIESQTPGFLSDADFDAITNSVIQQLKWLDEVIPTKKNNWVQIGCQGVLVTLAHLPNLPRGKEWSTRAWQRMSDGIESTLLPDGVHDEMAVTYQFVVVKFVLDALEFAGQTPTPPPEKLYDQIGSMLHCLRQTLVPDGEHIAAFNDSSPKSGAIVREFLERPLTQQLLARYQRPLESECFPWAGIMILREGETKAKDELYLAFDGGSFGVGHQHEDKLGFWLGAYGKSFLVDPGCHLYDRSDYSYWPFLRSTAAHSTITIDGCGQNSRAARDVPGAWRPEQPQPIVFEKRADGSCIAGAFYNLGYGEEQIAVTHYRIIFFYPDLQAWVIVDAVDCEGTHTIESRFQFAPGEVTQDDFSARTNFTDANLFIQGRAEDWSTLRIAKGEENPREGWYSENYGKIEPAPCVVYSTKQIQLPWQGVMALVPFKGVSVDDSIVKECLARAKAECTSALDKLRVLSSTH